MDLDDLNLPKLDEIFPPWFWYLGVGLAIGCASLLALWYIKHPGQSIFSTFQPVDLPQSGQPQANGNVPHTTAPSVSEAVEG